MTQLSVIIVNYNVKYFLEQAVLSALKACAKIDAEIIIIDNHSVDGSVEFITQKFVQQAGQHTPVSVIANQQNTGFSKANNQGIAIAKGKYVLLLNPDTVVEEDTFEKCIQFMDAHPDAGGLGVKMIDGKGNFLPESKRGFPSPEVAFYKVFGLANLFPKSKIFGKYHLGFLSENETHEVDVLAGAFMLIRKEALDKIGWLDEDFFMYGEDIDLSYRIVKGGYKNYYFPETRIIHYKGESTKKASFNYVKMFYNAMIIFAQKHFVGRRAGVFIFLLNIAIYFRAFLATTMRFIRAIAMPLLDALVFLGGMYVVKEYWEYYIKYIEGGQYPLTYLLVNIPLYIIIWILSIFVSGGYDRSTNISRIVRGMFWGTILIAAVYGFLPEAYRFSRGMIIAGAAFNTALLIAMRSVMHFIKYRNFRFGETPEKKILIVGNDDETERAHQLLNQLQLGNQIIGYVRTSENKSHNALELGNISMLNELIQVYKANEIIFCAKDISSQEIINHMVSLGQQIDFKIIPDQSLSIIGSNSKNSAGDIYTVDIQLKITLPESKRAKKWFDIIVALTALLISPILIFFVKNKGGLFANIGSVLFNKKTWVGYFPNTANGQVVLPRLKKGVLFPVTGGNAAVTDPAIMARVNFIYARDYRVTDDLEVVLTNIKALGN